MILPPQPSTAAAAVVAGVVAAVAAHQLIVGSAAADVNSEVQRMVGQRRRAPLRLTIGSTLQWLLVILAGHK